MPMPRMRFRLRSLLIAAVVGGLVLAALANLVRPNVPQFDHIVAIGVIAALLLVVPTFLAARIALRDPYGANRPPPPPSVRPAPRLGEPPVRRPRGSAPSRRRFTIGQGMIVVAGAAVIAALGSG